jgi:Phage protein (N4 Gp49/phage Sf6 gene 66) family
MNAEELETKLAERKFPRITKESIEEKIAAVDYTYIGTCGVTHGTLCLITMKNGWTSTGFSAPADPRNYDETVGMHYSYERAFKPLWELEGYLLREKLSQEGA